MSYGGVNYLGVLVATLVAMASGAVWYGALARPWMAAAGLSEQAVARRDHGIVPYLVAALAKFVMAFCLAKILRVLDGVSIGNGIAGALFIWIGFVATTLSVNHRFQLKPWSLTLIDGGYWLMVLVLMGIVIGFFG